MRQSLFRGGTELSAREICGATMKGSPGPSLHSHCALGWGPCAGTSCPLGKFLHFDLYGWQGWDGFCWHYDLCSALWKHKQDQAVNALSPGFRRRISVGWSAIFCTTLQSHQSVGPYCFHRHPPSCYPRKVAAQVSWEYLGKCCLPALIWPKATCLFSPNDHSTDLSSLLVSFHGFLGRQRALIWGSGNPTDLNQET